MNLEEFIINIPDDLDLFDILNYALNLAREEAKTWVIPCIWDAWKIESKEVNMWTFCVTRLY